MFSPARKSIVLTALLIAVIITGIALTHQSSEPTTNTTATVESTTTTPLYAVERELAHTPPSVFEDPRDTVIVADSNYQRISVTPAKYLGLTESEKDYVLQTYQNVADKARLELETN